MHHITAKGGKLPAPFKQALIQSPGWSTTIDVAGNWNKTLETASQLSGKHVVSGTELQSLSSTQLIQTNAAVVFSGTLGDFTYGPTVDGCYVPDMVGKLLLEGRFDTSPSLMIGHNADEAGAFVPTSITTAAEVTALLSVGFTGVNETTLEYILTDLYPSPSDTKLYDNEHDRLALIVSESSFTCNTRYLATAFKNATWNYRFQIPPASHGQDIPWTFYNDVKTDAINTSLAESMQLYFTNFFQVGHPNVGNELPNWTQYGTASSIETFGIQGIGTAVDDDANPRCAYWQKGEYLS